ncbi:MAG: DUF5018 domain-containing protein [Prevotellaceae bacterium]|nr:DUF5018 domain-containing protein [Prevotellaceae bacterium]
MRYTVTADDGVTKKTYVAKATRTKYRDAEILGFSVGGVPWPVIDGNINYSYAAGKEVSNLTPVITLSPGATVTPASRTSQNFFSDEGVTYVVTSEDGSATNTYVAKAKIKVILWMDRKLMSGHPIGNDAIPSASNGADRLFDSIGRSLGVTNSTLRSTFFSVSNPDGSMPIYYTIDLGKEAVLNMFWIEPRGDDRATGGSPAGGRYAFGSNGGASPYHWKLWGTTYDFAAPDSDHQAADDPYWTEGQWKSDPRWIDFGDYYYRRPSDPNATPENTSDETRTGDKWLYDMSIIYLPPGINNQMNFSLPEKTPVQYVRWEFIQSWWPNPTTPETAAFMHEAWFYEVIAE